MKARKVLLGLAVVAAVVFGAAGLAAGSGGGMTPVAADEAQAVHGAACLNIVDIFDGCGAGQCNFQGALYNFNGVCFNSLFGTFSCTGGVSCGQYHSLQNCATSYDAVE